ncbi:exopolysaccharide biosynthesis polyprenyl glycosylphosphotransferase, partial [Flavobacteriales bacterium]|nr:exopolysaccharide biosynthesis polyprenyl glycosylphosphotransferase [Flavobacteriales bacterium]
WWVLHASMGMYSDIRRRHRGLEIQQVFQGSAVGGVLLFFALLLDDVTSTHLDHYASLVVWLGTHVTLVLWARYQWTARVVHRVQSGAWAFDTILLGDAEANQRFLMDLDKTPGRAGWNIVKQISLVEGVDHATALASWEKERSVDRAVVTTPMPSGSEGMGYMAMLEGKGVELLVVPGALDFMAGTVRSSNLFGVPLVNLSRGSWSPGMRATKRVMDVVLSGLALLVLSPLFAWIAWRVKRGSDGPVFYRQERLGLHGLPFQIIKFRTMVTDAEGETPQLSSDEDPRITQVGRRLRQTRMDELPQFWNVLRGEMSMVGPRPERAFFADQIVEQSPHFLRLQKVRPGLTSWGQVKYGYAENVAQMRQRLRYDIMYLENISLLLDLKILLYTVKTVLRQEGK